MRQHGRCYSNVLIKAFLNDIFASHVPIYATSPSANEKATYNLSAVLSGLMQWRRAIIDTHQTQSRPVQIPIVFEYKYVKPNLI